MPRPITRTSMDDTGHRVEALGSWDHGLEAYDMGDWAEDPKVESVQEFAKRSCALAANALTSSIKGICESNLLKDFCTQEDTNKMPADKKTGANHASQLDSFENALYTSSFVGIWV
eukprot:252024_1